MSITKSAEGVKLNIHSLTPCVPPQQVLKELKLNIHSLTLFVPPQQVLRELGVRTPGTSPRVSTQDPLKSSPPLKPSPPLTLKLVKRNSVPDFPQSSPSSVLKRTSLPDSSQSLPPLSLKQEKKERRKHKNSTDSKSSSSNSHRSSLSDHEVDSLTRELALAKTQCAELSGQVEQKKMEVKQVLQREALAVRELHSAKRYIATLEQRVREMWPN